MKRSKVINKANYINFFTVLLLFAIIVNAIEFRSIDNEVHYLGFRAIYNYGTADIFQIAFNEDTHRLRHSFAHTVGTVSAGADIIIPIDYTFPEGWLWIEQYLYFLGNVNTIVGLEYCPEEFIGIVDSSTFVLSYNEYTSSEPCYRIFTNNVIYTAEFILLENDGVVILVDTSLLQYYILDEIEGIK